MRFPTRPHPHSPSSPLALIPTRPYLQLASRLLMHDMFGRHVAAMPVVWHRIDVFFGREPSELEAVDYVRIAVRASGSGHAEKALVRQYKSLVVRLSLQTALVVARLVQIKPHLEPIVRLNDACCHTSRAVGFTSGLAQPRRAGWWAGGSRDGCGAAVELADQPQPR